MAEPRVSEPGMYALYGIRLGTEFPLQSFLTRTHGPVDLTFTCTREIPQLLEGTAEIGGPAAPSDVRPFGIYLDRLCGVDVIRYIGIFDFYIEPHRIVCHLLDSRYEDRVEVALLGTVLSYWLERAGVPNLHASAVEVERSAIAFLADNRGGKSSLAVTFMQQGHPLLTDDILPLEQRNGIPYGRPGFPQIRLWPEHAESLLQPGGQFDFIHPDIPKLRIPVGRGFGAFSFEPLPLRCLYLPQRHQAGPAGTGIEIEPLSAREGLKQLLSTSFEPLLAEGAGLRAERLSFFGSLLRQVPIRRISYPDGVEHLPDVRMAILEDLACSAAGARAHASTSGVPGDPPARHTAQPPPNRVDT